jgi:type II secretory pathway pseudopilin PulG
MRPQRRSAFSLLELLVLLVCLALALGLLLPAAVKAREQAKKGDILNSLKQLCLAAHNYHDANNNFPMGCDGNNFSAAAHLLPYLEEEKLFKAIDFNKSVTDAANVEARKKVVDLFLSPRDPQKNVSDDYGPTNFLANELVLPPGKSLRITNITDGTSNTVLWVETLKGDGGVKAVDVKRQYVLLPKEDLKKGLPENAGVKEFKDNKGIAGDRCASWMDGRFLQGLMSGVGRKPNDERPDVNCEGLGGLSAARSLDDAIYLGICDGSVKKISAKKLSFETWKAAFTPDGGEILGADW